MTALPDFSPTVAEFAEVADVYCSLIDGSAGSTTVRLLLDVQNILPRLYAAALRLPDVWTPPPASPGDEDALDDLADEAQYDPNAVGPDPDAPTYDESRAMARRIGDQLTDVRYYNLVFAPYEMKDPEVVVGDLADDLTDIYCDLYRGRTKYRRGEVHEAAWEWQFHFAAHWGRHAVDAIRAIHALAFDNDIRASLEAP